MTFIHTKQINFLYKKEKFKKIKLKKEQESKPHFVG